MWSLTRRGREVCITKSSSSTTTENEFLSECIEIDNTLIRLRIRYDRPKRNLDNMICPRPPSHDFRPASLSIFGADRFFMTEIRKRVDIFIDTKDDISTTSAISSIGTAVRYVLLSSP